MIRSVLRTVPTLVVAATLTTCLRAQENEGATPLVEGTDPAQFTLVGIGPETLTIADGVVTLTGKPNGYFATKKDYDNYVLTFDWKYERPADLTDDAVFDGNSGLLLHIGGEHKVWPKCIEAQLQYGDAGHVFAINGAAFKGAVETPSRKEAQDVARKPVGEWNTMEVTCRDDRIACRLNGFVIDEGQGATPASGPIGWQSEGRPLSLRNLMIKPLK